MKKNILLPAFIVLLAMLAAGCTQNNGHIGKLFGSWSLQEMTENGTPLRIEGEGIAVSFQSNVVRFTLIYGPDLADNSIATWTRTGDILNFNFNNHDDKVAAGTGVYAPPFWLHLTELTESFVIARLEAGHLELVRTDAKGDVYVYKFDRTW